MDNKTIETYNKIADIYDKETIDFWKSFPRTFFDKFIKISSIKIADIGSGPGRDGLILKDSGKDVTCVDASEVMIKLSTEKGLKSIVASFDELPFEDESFDGVWSYTALLHTPKTSIDKALSEIYRILKPSGVFALGLIEGNTEEYKVETEANLSRWFSYYQKEEIESICKRHGFELVYFETFKPKTKNYLNFIFKKMTYLG